MRYLKVVFALLAIVIVIAFLITIFLLSKNNSVVDNQTEFVKPAGTGEECYSDIIVQPPYQDRIIKNMTYSEFYGEGKSPIPEADKCNSNIGTVAEIFPDKYLAHCISETFTSNENSVLSQYFFDQIATFYLLKSGASSNPDSECSKHIDDISDLTGMEHFRNLRQIGLDGTNISNISVFSQMPFLETIDLRGSAVTDITPILKHDFLETIFLPKDNQELNTQPLVDAGIGFR